MNVLSCAVDFDDLVAGLLGERGEIALRSRVGGQHLQNLTARHVGERLLCPQNRQRTVEPARVDFLVNFHRD